MRLCFLGSSTTDGDTYPTLLKQALHEAGRPLPLTFNAGIGGDVQPGMIARLQRDVLVHRPTLVALQTSANTAGMRQSTAEFEAGLEHIILTLKEHNADSLIMTPNIRGPSALEFEQIHDQYEAAMRRLIAKYQLRVAQVYTLMKAARAQGAKLVEADDLHPNFEGHRIITRALLDALGHADVAVPKVINPPLHPGVLNHWKVLAVDEDLPVGGCGQPQIPANAKWHQLTIPQPARADMWWFDQVRAQGYVMMLDQVIRPAKKFIALSTLACESASDMVLNTGAGLQRVYLNQQLVYEVSPDFRGFHAGRERIPVHLSRGENSIMIESANDFFLSITPSRDW